MSAVAPEAGIAYYLGGYEDGTTAVGWTGSRRWRNELVGFDMVKREYFNLSGPPGEGFTGRGDGYMGFLPASSGGVLVYFGGVLQKGDGSVTGVCVIFCCIAVFKFMIVAFVAFRSFFYLSYGSFRSINSFFRRMFHTSCFFNSLENIQANQNIGINGRTFKLNLLPQHLTT